MFENDFCFKFNGVNFLLHLVHHSFIPNLLSSGYWCSGRKRLVIGEEGGGPWPYPTPVCPLSHLQPQEGFNQGVRGAKEK